MRFIHRYTYLFVLLFIFALALPVIALQETNGSDISGRIAYVGDDFNIHVFDAGTEETVDLTDNASATVRYQWPTWSNDGRLAYFCCDLEFTTDFNTSAYISSDAASPGRLVFDRVGESVIYAAWAPAPCGDASCRELAMLVNSVQTGGLNLSMVRDTLEETQVDIVAMGSPFYYSWSPDASQLAFHRNNRRLSIYSGALGDVDESLDQRTSGAFQAPHWSPVDDRILLGIPGDGPRQTNLVILEEGDVTVLEENLPGGLSFAWSPDGQYVAYRVLDDNGYGPLVILDAATGVIISQTALPGVVAFFWSPDSSKLAYVTPAIAGGNSASNPSVQRQFVQYTPGKFQSIQSDFALSWNVLDIQSDSSTTFAPFLPTPGLIYMILYFDQFAQSHSIWSPDSQYIVYPELMLEDSMVSLVQIRNVLDVTAPPIPIGHGGFAVWSYDE